MKKVLTIGGATQDIFIKYENPQMLRIHSKKHKKEFVTFEEGSKIEIQDLSYSTGGGATNSGTSFSRLGFDVSTIFKTGDDTQANMIIEKLKKENIDISHIKKSSTLLTGTSIIIPCLSGDRTVLVYRGSNTQLKKEDINKDLIANCDQLYITSLSGKSSKLLGYITEIAKKHNVPIATNPGSSQLAAGAPQLRDSLPNIDIFILNSDEASKFMHTLVQAGKQLKPDIMHENIYFNLQQYFKEVLKRGPKIAAVTNGAEGVYVAKENTIYFHPSMKTKIVSTLGAGDSFGSCFVASLSKGKSLKESLLRGIINATSVISYLDAKTGLLTNDELEKRAAKITTKHIIKFPLS